MDKALWDKAVFFHGHVCPGLAIGFKACEAAVKHMGLSPAYDEEIVCITENDACGVDAIQALMSCTIGKGNLILKETGKSAYTFILRDKNLVMRFYFKAKNNGLSREDFMNFILKSDVDEIFSYKKLDIKPPEKARRFVNIDCENCGEAAPEHKIRLQEGKKLCLDCYKEYKRGW